MSMRPNVFAYFDSRRFLRDAQQEIKSRRKAFTLEFLATQVGLKSKGHVSLILSGEKNIPDEKISLFAKALELDERESVFFSHLVKFNQAATHRERKQHLDRMVAQMRIADRKLVPRQYALCETWWHPVVHEVLRIKDVKDDWAGLGLALRPAITPEQAKESVQLLEEIGLVKKDPNGFWKPTDVVVTFGEGWKSVAVREFQRNSIEMAQGAIDRFPVAERDISMVTISVGKESFDELKERLSLFRREALALARNDRNPDRVCHLNLSLFPVSDTQA